MKKILISILLLLISNTLFSCGGNNTIIDTTVKFEDPQASISDTEEDIYSSLVKRDFGGMEFRIHGYAPSSSMNDDESFFAEQTGEVIDDSIYKRNLETETLLNIKLIYETSLPANDARNRIITGVMAGDDFCDICIYKSGGFGAIVTNGVLKQWNDLDGINLNNPWYVQNANESISIGGIQYAIFSDACKTNITMCWTTVFNKNLVDDWNIINPYSLVKSGDWTMDKLIALTKDVYSDLNGDNVSDANDLYGYYTDSFATLDAFMISHGVQAVSKAKDDIPVLNFYSENLIKSFGKVYDLYWNNSATYVVTDKAYTYIKSFSDGHAMFSPMLIDYMLTDLRTMKDDYGILPYPKLDKEQNNYYTYLLSRPGMLMLPATVSNEKLGKVGYVVEALSAYSYKFLRPAIYDEALLGKGTRDEESFEMLDLIMNTRTYDFSGFNETAGGIGDFPFNPAKTYRSLLSKKNINITSYYEANKVAGNEYLSKLVKLYNP